MFCLVSPSSSFILYGEGSFHLITVGYMLNFITALFAALLPPGKRVLNWPFSFLL